MTDHSVQTIRELIRESEEEPAFVHPLNPLNPKLSIFRKGTPPSSVFCANNVITQIVFYLSPKTVNLLMACIVVGVRWCARKKRLGESVDALLEDLFKALHALQGEIQSKSERYKSAFKEPVPLRVAYGLTCYPPVLHMFCLHLKGKKGS